MKVENTGEGTDGLVVSFGADCFDELEVILFDILLVVAHIIIELGLIYCTMANR